MKPLMITYLALFSLLPLHAANPSMKAAQKEAEKTAKHGVSSLKEQLRGKEELGFSDQDLLPDWDKGKKFDVATAEDMGENSPKDAQMADIQETLISSKKRERIEENERFLIEGHSIIQQPHSSIDITSLTTQVTPEESTPETCQESGTYQITLSQTLTVTATPEIKNTSHHCNGHRQKKTYDTKEKAKAKRTKKQELFKKDVDIASYTVERDGQYLISTWTHKDNAGSCNNFHTEDNVTQEAKEEDLWNTENPEALSIVESTPSCKLLYTKFAQDPETRVINGKAVARDAWARQLYFSCEPPSDSKCAQLRSQAGILVSKKCLSENDLGECDLWEKVYELGKKGAFQQTNASFKNDTIWGLEGEFDSSYEKNTDFGSTITTLSVFSELENTLENQSTDFYKDLKIFNGDDLKCQKSFGTGAVFDCCKKMEGMAVDIKLAGCSTEEKCLAENRKRGKCHFIGSKKVKLGTVTEHVFCCFPTKLSRVIHEQGREQLTIKWGSAEKPKCRGLTLEELQQIDFSKIDLSEVIDDIKIDKTAYERSLKGSVDSLTAKVQRTIAQKRLAPIAEATP